MKHSQCWSQYTTIKQFEELHRQEKIKEAIKNLIAGIGLGIMGMVVIMVLMSM